MTKFLLTLKMTKQGNIKGSSKSKEGDLDYSKGIECHGFNLGVASQIDPPSHGSSGRRKQHPITIRKEVDEASPLLLQALSTNELIATAELSFNRIGPDGKPAVVHTIELTNGHIISIKPVMGSAGKRYEDVTVSYNGLRVNGTGNGIIPHSALGFVGP